MPERETADLIIEPRWLLPVAPANVALPGQALAVRGGRIAAVGPAAELRERFPGAERVVRARHALLPGLVNAHTRACHALLRTPAPRGPHRRWLTEALAPLGPHGLSADFVRDGTRLAIAQMLRAGITCYADLSPLPAEAARTAAAAEMRALIGLPVSDAPTPWAEDATTHLAQAAALWDEYRDHPRLGLYFAPLPAEVSEATLERMRRVADELDARIAIELHELPAARTAGPAPYEGIADGGGAAGGALARLAALGLVRPGFTAIGALGCTPAAQELLARHGAALIACPHAELRLGSALPAGTWPARGAGGRLALGTDSPAAAGALDVLSEARLAALLGGLGAHEALRLATAAGADVLGLGAEIGTLEAGKAADLACIDLEGAAETGADAVAAAIVFGAVRTQVSDVWTGGRLAVSGGRVLRFDPAQLEALPGAWAARLALGAAA